MPYQNIRLSGCDADKPAETAPVTEEVTTTAEVTTSAATTTTESAETAEVTTTTSPTKTTDDEASGMRMTIDLLIEQNIECYKIFTYIAFNEVEKIDGIPAKTGMPQAIIY